MCRNLQPRLIKTPLTEAYCACIYWSGLMTAALEIKMKACLFVSFMNQSKSGAGEG